jgi:hypothetical protein
LDEKVNVDATVDIFLHVRNVVEGQFWRSYEGRPGTLLQYLLMPPENPAPYSFEDPEEAVFFTGLETDDKIRLLMNEQRNVIESAPFQSLFQHSINIGFAGLSESIAKSFPKSAAPAPSAEQTSDETAEIPKSTLVEDHRVPLAKLIPALSNHFKTIIDPKENILTERITNSNDFNEFSYRIFHGPVKSGMPWN